MGKALAMDVQGPAFGSSEPMDRVTHVCDHSASQDELQREESPWKLTGQLA